MTRKHHSFFYLLVLVFLLISVCLSGCLNQESHSNETISAGNDTPVSKTVSGVIQPAATGESTYMNERLSPEMQTYILTSVNEIPYLSTNKEMNDQCIQSDPHTIIAIVLRDPNVQDMLMKSGHITGIGPYLPRSAKANPGNGKCTAAVYISCRNITSGFVIDQERQIVSGQVLEVPSETHVRASGNRTIVLINDSVVFVFDNQQYFLNES